jgi:dTDP-3-amino-3,4,6-trideoxy-alpha-D-glucose transaminase
MTPPIPFVDLARQHQPVASELHAAFERVLGASSYILGEEVARFEDEFAAYCGARHCVGVASGTAALTIAALAAGIGPGDEVIVPAHTFIASALGIVHAGAVPVFCDVDPGTGLIDPAAAESAVSDRTAAILAVHLYGQMCDMDALQAVTRRHGLLLLEDAAQAHGARYGEGRAGSFGAASAFSFYPSKNLGALGDGGAVCTDDPFVAERARRWRNLGQLGKGDHAVLGFNERLDGLQAAFLRAKLPHLDAWNEQRRARAAEYREALTGSVRLVEERPESPSVFHLFAVRIEDRDGLAARLGSAGVATGVHYSPTVPAQPPFEGSGEDFPEAAAWAREELSLPMFESLARDEVLRVSELFCATAPTSLTRGSPRLAVVRPSGYSDGEVQGGRAGSQRTDSSPAVHRKLSMTDRRETDGI